jgi:hypothetical protein
MLLVDHQSTHQIVDDRPALAPFNIKGEIRAPSEGLSWTAEVCGDKLYKDGSTLKRFELEALRPPEPFSTNSQSFCPSSDITKRMNALATSGLGAPFRLQSHPA